jgi:O-6-methylguanine DNA methyltransferase
MASEPMTSQPPRYRVQPTELGPLLVCGSAAGLLLVSLGDAEIHDFARRFTLVPRDETCPHLRAWGERIAEYLQGQRRRLDVPVTRIGTPFQRQVWHHLRTISYGQVRSYRQIAEALGRPTAARAVGQACAANPVCLVVPCHRAIRADGSLGGFRWGVELKRKLLEMEGAYPLVVRVADE